MSVKDIRTDRAHGNPYIIVNAAKKGVRKAITKNVLLFSFRKLLRPPKAPMPIETLGFAT